MYTWGYIKQACLAKLDMSANQAIENGLLNKFPFYANEAITQITSAIKPKREYVEFKVRCESKIVEYCKQTYHLDNVSFLFNQPCDLSGLSLNELSALKEYNSYVYIGKNVSMPNDFFSWNDDKSYICNGEHISEATDKNYNLFGNNKILFLTEGDYKIPYNARWFIFNTDTNDDVELDVPYDILDCLPSYIVSQCYKIDDEQKSSIYRNEYEMFLARIDENDLHTNKTIRNWGDW